MSNGKARKAHVTLHKDPDGKDDYCAFEVQSQDGKDLTAQQILEAVAEALILKWDHCPLEEFTPEDYDA